MGIKAKESTLIMNRLKKVSLLLMSLQLLLSITACSDKNEVVIPEITVPIESENYFQKEIVFSNNIGEKEITFTTNVDWSISVAETRNGSQWCTVSPSHGTAGTHKIRIKTEENLGYDDRSVVVTISAGELQQYVTITQKQKDAITLASNRFEISSQGGDIKVEVNSNVKYEVVVPEYCSSWINQQATTRGLSTSFLSFSIAPSEEYEKREGEIIVKHEELSETIHIYQSGESILLLSKNEYMANGIGEIISAEIKSNFNFDVQMPNVEWITELTETRGVSSHTLYYQIAPNELTESRDAEIIYYDKSNQNVRDTLKIIQSPHGVAVIQLNNAGSLNNYINEANKYTINNLAIIGEVNGTDIKLIREMAGCDFNGKQTDGQLSVLDLSKAHIVEGGEEYKEGYTTLDENGNETMHELHTANNTIGEYMFSGTKLSEIQLPETTTTIEMSAFNYCRFLKKIIMPEGITRIMDMAFLWCVSLEEINIPDSLSAIEYGVFGHCDALQTVIIPDGIKSIGEYAFSSCVSLTSVSIPSSVTEIQEGAFDRCIKLQEIHLPENLNYLSGFSDCTFKSISIPNSVTVIGENAFSGCTELSDISIPKNVISIEKNAFQGCTNLQEIELPENLIYLSGFANCTNLRNISIPGNVSVIGARAFAGCTGLTTISIPGNVETIEDTAFQDCTELTSINLSEGLLNFSGIDGCTKLESVSLPNSVKSIGYIARCTNVKQINIPNNVDSIVPIAFQSWHNLTSIKIPQEISYIGDQAFSYCSKLESINFPGRLKSVPSYICHSCYNLQEVEIEEGISEIGGGAFYQCTCLEEIEFPSTLKNIEGEAFYHCMWLEKIVCKSPTPPTIGTDCWGGNVHTETAKVYVPADAVNAYRTAEGWKEFENIEAISE
ncbi:MAG: hypothetical protein E7099_07960 [Mediterranea massiliensis]|nr:hypothetical protein [Mediterranea massiliensis]